MWQLTVLWFLSSQTPDSWSDNSQSRRGSSSHKRSASWGSVEHLREVSVCLYCLTRVFVTLRFASLGIFSIKDTKLLEEKKALVNYFDSIEKQEMKSNDLISIKKLPLFSFHPSLTPHRVCCLGITKSYCQ